MRNDKMANLRQNLHFLTKRMHLAVRTHYFSQFKISYLDSHDGSSRVNYLRDFGLPKRASFHISAHC